MVKPRRLYETVNSKFNTALGKRIISHNHRGKRVEKAYSAARYLSNGRVLFGELCLALLFMTTSYLRGNDGYLPNNTTLVYPLNIVSTLECRTQHFSALPENCKISLPIIHGADYNAYKNEKTYTDIYTVLRGGSYTHPRNPAVGSHYGVDIATSKGTPIYAIADGEVQTAEFNSAYGNVIKIRFKYK
jgi:murein DD-endopeptidase MepM/ murein hydrolase activator NlpD